MKNYTKVMGFWNCNDCGAFAKKKEDVKHYLNCKETKEDNIGWDGTEARKEK